MNVRPATGSDAAEVARLCTELGYSVSEEVMHGRLGQLLNSPAHLVVVAQRESALRGWICGERRVSLESGTRVEISGLIVDPSLRRSGIGRLLVSEIERWALSQDCQEVMVRSNVARLESHPFYESLGYKRAKTQHAYKRAPNAA
jgi:GNAT superfamily N-acetyltransferase